MIFQYLEQAKEQYHLMLGEKNRLEKEKEVKTLQLHEVNNKLTQLEQIRELFKEASSYAREQARIQLENIVTQALQSVFGPQIKALIPPIEIKRNQPDATLKVVCEYNGTTVETTLEYARGGGVIDVYTTALLCAFAEMLDVKGPMILDEPGRYLSEENIASFGAFLQMFNKEFDRQLLVITHDRTLAQMGDQEIFFSLDGKGQTQYKVVKKNKD